MTTGRLPRRLSIVVLAAALVLMQMLFSRAYAASTMASMRDVSGGEPHAAHAAPDPQQPSDIDVAPCGMHVIVDTDAQFSGTCISDADDPVGTDAAAATARPHEIRFRSTVADGVVESALSTSTGDEFEVTKDDDNAVFTSHGKPLDVQTRHAITALTVALDQLAASDRSQVTDLLHRLTSFVGDMHVGIRRRRDRHPAARRGRRACG